MDAEGERLPSRLGLTIGLTIEQTIGIGLYVQPIYIAEPWQANRTGNYWKTATTLKLAGWRSPLLFLAVSLSLWRSTTM